MKVHGRIPVTSLYTAGAAGEEFLRALRDRGEILGSPCVPCGAVYVPARGFCERCFAELAERRPVGPEGAIEAATVCRRDKDGREPAAPPTAVLVKLDGATTPMVHLFLGAPGAARIGARVRAVLEPRRRRRGSILDLRGFEPV